MPRTRPLKARQAMVLDMAASGLTQREIAATLRLNRTTVRQWLRDAAARLGCDTVPEAVRAWQTRAEAPPCVDPPQRGEETERQARSWLP